MGTADIAAGVRRAAVRLVELMRRAPIRWAMATAALVGCLIPELATTDRFAAAAAAMAADAATSTRIAALGLPQLEELARPIRPGPGGSTPGVGAEGN